MLVSFNIRKIAEEVLDKPSLHMAEKYALRIYNSTKDKMKIFSLVFISLDDPGSKVRPLLYAKTHAIGREDLITRDIVRYLGDYIDILVKAMALEKSGNKKCREYSLGKNLPFLKDKVPQELLSNLALFNNLIYVPAKHKFETPKSPREHLFTEEEAVYVCFIAFYLGEKIVNISWRAKKAADGEIWYLED